MKIDITDATEPENTDLETVALSNDPDFLELIQSSRARHAHEGGLSSAEIRDRLKREASD